MGLRFQKRVKVLPGVTLNIGKTGFSTSLGPCGAKLNIGARGKRGTVGVPGTGVSFSERLDAPGRQESSGVSVVTVITWVVIVAVVVFWIS